jgi:hypothetical protein
VSSFALKRSTFTLPHPLHFPTSPLPPLPPKPPRIVLSPPVMHAPPVPGLSITHSWMCPPKMSPSQTRTHLNLSLSASQPQPLRCVHAQDYLASFSAASQTCRPVHGASQMTLLTSHLSPSCNLTLSDAQAMLCACKLSACCMVSDF